MVLDEKDVLCEAVLFATLVELDTMVVLNEVVDWTEL